MMDSDEETAFMGLTDIISNLMVLFILLTVFVLTIKVNEAAENNNASGKNGSEGGEFVDTLNSELYGAVTTFVVAENGFGQLDWPAIATNIANQSSRTESTPFSAPIYVPRQEGASAPEAITPSVRPPSGASNVIDSYTISFPLGRTIPDWAVIAPDQENLIQALRTATAPGTSLSFIVYPEALPAFVPVYETLIQDGVCFRWTPWDADSSFIRLSVSYAGQNRCSL